MQELGGAALGAFARALSAVARLSATVDAEAPAVCQALVCRHALLAAGGGEQAAYDMVRTAEFAAAPKRDADSPGGADSLTAKLAMADLEAVVPEALRGALDAVWSAERPETTGVLDAAEAAGLIVATAPASRDAERAATLAAALCMARGGITSAPYLSVWRLDSSARSAAVQLDRSNAWGEWVRAWCALLLREAVTTLHAVENATLRAGAERKEMRARHRTGATDEAVSQFLHSHLRFTVREASEALQLTTPTVGSAIARLESAGIATELTGQRRDRVWVSGALLGLIVTR